MSEEIIKEENTDSVADFAPLSASERLRSLDLDFAKAGVGVEKTPDEIRAENKEKFAEIKARMAKRVEEAEERAGVRVREISAQRRAEEASAEEKSASPTVSGTALKEESETVPVADAVPEEKSAEDELVIKLGGSPSDYGEKCVIRVGTPSVTSYVFTSPTEIQSTASQGKTVGRVTARAEESIPERKESEFLYAPTSELPESDFLPEPYDDELYETRYPEYSEEIADYPDPIPERPLQIVDAERTASISPEREATVSAEEEEYRQMREESQLRAMEREKFDLFELSQLNKVISAFYKEEAAYARKIQKIEAKQKDADTEGNIVLIVEKIALQKQMCELAVETLGACVYTSAKGKTARHERLLRLHIDRYNLYCEEYEKYTGRALHRLDYGMIEDTLSGRISKPIPNVYYYGASGDAVYSATDAENDRLHREENEYEALSREYERYLEDGGSVDPTPAERHTAEKRNAARISAIRRATERDILLVALRNEYRLESLEARRDILLNSYGSDKGKVMKELRSIERTVSKVRAASRRSIPLEREDNTRYYLLSALDMQNEKVKAGARRDRLMSLRQRLEVLLSERESINERLIVLYGGSDRKLKKAKINRKAAAVRRKSARKSFKRQADLARRIERFNVSSDMKEKAYALLNRKTAAVAKADEIRYKITHLKPHGRARGELYAEFKSAKKEIKRTDSEIRYMLRRLKKIQDRLSDRREFAVLFILIAVFVAVLGIVWVSFGDEIVGYFKELYAKLRGL